MDLLVGKHRFDRSHYVQPATAGELGPGVEALIDQQITRCQGGLDDKIPCNPLAWIEIKDEMVRPLDVIDRRGPRMNFDNTDRHPDRDWVSWRGKLPRTSSARGL